MSDAGQRATCDLCAEVMREWPDISPERLSLRHGSYHSAGREATACGCPEEALIRSHVEGCPWFTAFVEAGREATRPMWHVICGGTIVHSFLTEQEARKQAVKHNAHPRVEGAPYKVVRDDR